MTEAQRNLFGAPAAQTVKAAKAKPLPKLAPVAPKPSAALTPGQQGVATRNRNALQSSLKAARESGLPRFTSPCSECGLQRIEAYEFNVWVAACVNASCSECEANRPEYKQAMEVMRGK